MMSTYDAIILAGGRSSRLGGTPKAQLSYRGTSLLARTLEAVDGGGGVVVVGPRQGHESGSGRPPGVLWAREEPPFAGPAAALAAGVTALEHARTGPPQEGHLTLILACDMPDVGTLVPALVAEAQAHPGYGVWVPVDTQGYPQYLACAADTVLLRESVRAAGNLTGKPVRLLLASLQGHTFAVPGSTTADVDTWEDADAFGITAGPEP